MDTPNLVRKPFLAFNHDSQVWRDMLNMTANTYRGGESILIFVDRDEAADAGIRYYCDRCGNYGASYNGQNFICPRC